MQLSTKSRYGVRAILELALAYGKKPLQVRVIAKQQAISSKYLEQLMAMLKSAGLLKSVRGSKGGYLLARPPTEITLYHVLEALEGPVCVIECLRQQEVCSRAGDCLTRPFWSEINTAIVDTLESTTLQDLLDRSGERQHQATNYQI